MIKKMDRKIRNLWQEYRWNGFKVLQHWNVLGIEGKDIEYHKRMATKYHDIFLMIRQIIIER